MPRARPLKAALAALIAFGLVPSTASAIHLTDTGTGTAGVPWGFHESWGSSASGWSANVAAQQAELAAAIAPATSATHFTVQWSGVERQPGQYDWTRTDAVYDTLLANSLEPVMVIFDAPWWARDSGASCPADEGRACTYPPLPEHYEAWEDFVEAAVDRYPDAVAIEVWNEPNIGRFWAPAPDPVRYAAVLGHAHQAVRDAGSTAPVLLGGLVPTNNITPAVFLDRVYDNGGADDFEGIASHPYSRQQPLVETTWARVETLTDVSNEHLDFDTPIWITEVGVSSDETQSTGVNSDDQGDELVRLHNALRGHEVGSSEAPEQPEVASFIIYRLIDDSPGGEGTFFRHMGVLNPDLTPKTAYCELTALLGALCDVTPPDTAVDSGPSGAIATDAASFSFSASEAGSSFRCRIDGGELQSCAAPRYYDGLAEGQHTFEVVATDPAGNVDPSPATQSFAVDTGAPETSLLEGPGAQKIHGSASFRFGASEASGFECNLDRRGWTGCSAPQDYGALDVGTHRFSVRAIDAVGNIDPDPATQSWSTDYPRRAKLGAGKRRGGRPALLGEDDNGYYAIRSKNRDRSVASWYGRFAGVPNSLGELGVAYRGKSSARCRQTVSIWEWDSSSWTRLESGPLGGREKSLDTGPSGDPAGYVSGGSGDGELRVRVRCVRERSRFTLRADLLRIAYEL
jgi:hypothetical protein